MTASHSNALGDRSRRWRALRVAKKDVAAAFEARPTKILRTADIGSILKENRTGWRVAQRTTLADFVEFLVAETALRRIEMPFPRRKELRYTWGEVSLYELLLTLRPDSYLSHYTAVFIHELTEQVPKSIYLNQEQSPKPHADAGLEQSRIDEAFRRPPRITRNVANVGGFRAYVLNGQHTGGLGVVEVPGPAGERVRVTNVERTLIDIAVRPFYAGGIHEVLKAYRLASTKVSVNKLVATLRKLDYVYPYHQAVGFYLERSAAYRPELVEMLHRMPMSYDFYLAHQMRQTEYSKRWRLFFPKGL